MHLNRHGQPDDDYLRNRVARLTLDLKLERRRSKGEQSRVPACVAWPSRRTFHARLLDQVGVGKLEQRRRRGEAAAAEHNGVERPAEVVLAGHMHRGHDLWNISLKFLCES